MSVDFNSIDSVLSLNQDELKDKKFDNDTEKFVVKLVQKYDDFIYKEDQKKRKGEKNIDHFNIMLYKELIKIFPDNQSLLYKHIKDCIDNLGDEDIINIVRSDIFRLRTCQNISEKTYNICSEN